MLLCNAVTEADWSGIRGLGERHGSVMPFLGIHPWHAATAVAGWQQRLGDLLAASDQHIGLGETGLDKTCKSDFTCQVNVLETHLELAHSLSRPVTLHCVRSWGRLVDILESCARQNRLPVTMIHSFFGSYEVMKRLTDIGCYISYSLSIVDQPRQRVTGILSRTPVDRLLLETDAPARFSPLLFINGKTITGYSEPVQIPAFYQWAARQLNIEPDPFKRQLWRNGQIYTDKTFVG